MIDEELYARIMKATGASPRYYIHGDYVDGFRGVYYCAKCDLFTEGDHFRDLHSKDDQSNEDRAEQSWKRYGRASTAFRKRQVRLSSVLNLFL